MNPCNPEYTYIFGHTPLCYVNDDHSFNIWYDPDYHNKIGIDGGLAVADRGQLNCLCLLMELLIKYLIRMVSQENYNAL